MKIKIMKSLLSVAILAAMTNYTSAAPIGTPAGDTISNTASIVYDVGGTTQTAIESSEGGNSIPGSGSATTFVVDEKVDLTVTAPTGVTVTPGSAQDITFTLTNEGNGTRDFSFASLETETGSDDFNPTSCTTPANETAVISGETRTITVSCTIPASGVSGVVNGATADVDLMATAVGASADATADAGADVSNSVQTVLADGTGTATDIAAGGDRNASHSAINTYTINTADLTVMKIESVDKMSFDLGVNDATATDVSSGVRFHIPGSTIKYEITVSNADGAAAARSIVLTDPIPGDMTYVSCSVSGPAVIDTVHPAAVSGTAVTPTCSYSSGTGNVTTSSFTLPGGTGGLANKEILTIFATVK